jgi:poly-gamma-glutamate synthesis protein (capsule biosynthesis protein)
LALLINQIGAVGANPGARRHTIAMPEAWRDTLEPALANFLAEGWAFAENAGEADVIIEPAPPEDAEFTLATAALVMPLWVPVQAAITTKDVQTWMDEGKPPYYWRGWDLRVSDELAVLMEAEPPPEKIAAHADALALALKSDPWAGTMALVRLETPDWPAGLRVLPIDYAYPTAPGYPLSVGGIVRGDADAADVIRAALLALPGAVVSIYGVGDMMLDRGIGWGIENVGVAYPSEWLGGLLAGADIATGNLECTISERGEPFPEKWFTFRAAPVAAEALAYAGFDVINLANNHSLDYGPDALEDTIALLAEQGIDTVGAGMDAAQAGAPAIREVRGLRIGFLGYAAFPDEYTGHKAESYIATDARAGIAWSEPTRIAADVAALRERVDLVVVILHAGREGTTVPYVIQIESARAAVNAGAALVLGHHPHYLQGVEFWGKGVIAYSLANFIFEMTEGASSDTVVFQAWLGAEGVRALSYHPITIDGGIPKPADPETAERIRHNLAVRSADLGPDYVPPDQAIVDAERAAATAEAAATTEAP